MYSLGKCNQPQDIAKANENVLRLKHAIVSYFVSPFDSDLRHSPNLYNIVSGTPVAEIVKDCMLSLKDSGKKLKDLFEDLKRKLLNAEFFSQIEKIPLKCFQFCVDKVKVKKGDKEKQIAAQRDVFGMLLSTSHKTKSGVDLEASLIYPLANHPPALCVPGGIARKYVKSKLFDAALKDLGLIDIKQLPGKEILHTYFLDVIALMRVLPRNNKTVKEFAGRILKSITQQYSIIFLVCDSYKDHSIKNKERLERGTGMKYVLKSPGMQMPSDFSAFMKNGGNKTILLN